eukprot:8203412-Lingulodinium_polyedra.AAC.1
MSIERPLNGHRTSTKHRTNRTANNRPSRPKASLSIDDSPSPAPPPWSRLGPGTVTRPRGRCHPAQNRW